MESEGAVLCGVLSWLKILSFTVDSGRILDQFFGFLEVAVFLNLKIVFHDLIDFFHHRSSIHD